MSHRVSQSSQSSLRSLGGHPFKVVKIDGLVILKIMKHFGLEGGLVSSIPVQGVLLGLLENDTLEITNCFAFPRQGDDDHDFDEVTYQRDMVKNLRKINIDHLQVGWYQSSVYGYFLSKSLIEAQHSYQNSVEESVVVIYDPARTSQGCLGIKAFRLKANFMKLFGDAEINMQLLNKYSMNYDRMFEEVPVTIRNSSLVKSLLSEMDIKYPQPRDTEILNLGFCSSLERQMQMLMDYVDRLGNDSTRYLSYYRGYMKAQQQRAQHQQQKERENMLREKRGEPLLPQEDLDRMFRLPQPPHRLDNILNQGQVKNFCEAIQQGAAQSFGKLFMAEALHLADG